MRDWRRKAETLADVRVAIRDVLDELPAQPYPRVVYDAKVQAVFDHVRTVYGDDGSSAYDEADLAVEDAPAALASVDELTEAVVERIRRDAAFAELVASRLRGEAPTFARSIEELIANDEDDAVEFKSTARWDVREAQRSPAMEDAIVKTAAAFLNFRLLYTRARERGRTRAPCPQTTRPRLVLSLLPEAERAGRLQGALPL